jgi:hypothetical protein
MPADLKKGSTGKAVKDLQTFLKMDEASIDGNFGDGTVAALNSWKKSVALPEDGIVDSQTRIAIAYQKFSEVALAQAIDIDETDYDGIEEYAEMNNIIKTAAESSPEQTANTITQTTSENLLEGLTAPLPKSVTSTPAANTEVDDFMAALAGLDNLVKPATPAPISNATTQIINNNAVTAANSIYEQANQTASTTSTVISNVESNLTTNASTAINNQNAVIQKLNNLTEYLNPATINTVQTNNTQIQEAAARLEASNISKLTESATASEKTQTVETSRVESSELISQASTNQIIRPENPVVQSVDLMASQMSTSIQNLGTDLSKTVSTIKSGDQINTSSVTQVDQSSIYSMNKPETPMTESIARAEDQAVKNYNNRMNDATLNAIYELLASGIKVKISS